MCRGYSRSIAQILDMFESVYGPLEVESTILVLLSSFLLDNQRVRMFLHCLMCSEHILFEAVELGQIQPSQTADMLRSAFFMGRRLHLQDVCGHKDDTIRDFDKHRVEAHRVEQQYRCILSSQIPSKQTHCKSATDVASDKFAKIKWLLSKL